MYHRIANVDIDPWELAVSPDHFEQHLQVLKEFFPVVNTSELVNLPDQEVLFPNTAAITLDDGYSDNYYFAKPILEKHNCPATFYIPSYYLSQQHKFWWDELTDIFLTAASVPAKLSLIIGGKRLVYDIADATTLTNSSVRSIRSWKAKQPPPNMRCEIYLKLCTLLRQLSLKEVQLVLEQVRAWANFYKNDFDEYAYPIDLQQLLSLSQSSLFQIGLHTVTHPALAFHSYEKQEEEIALNKRQLEMYIQNDIKTIAYPHGSYNENTVDIVKKYRLQSAFTTKRSVTVSHTDPFRIGRFHVKNWDKKTFRNKLSEWVSKY